jgi:protein-disulfide isomerase
MNRPHHSARPDLVVPVNPTDHVLGSERAAAVVVEYGDFECPICKQAAPAVKMLLQRFHDRVQFVFRHFPLEALHPHALQAAQAAESAAAQGKFWPMHDLLFANQEHLQLKHLRDYAGQLGLDMARFDAEMRDEIYLQRVREHIDGGRRSHLKSTPGFFVNGVIVDVSFGLHAVLDATAAALTRQPRTSGASGPE